MRSKELKLRRLHVSDAPMLKEAGVFSGSNASMENEIRKINSDDSVYSYVVLTSDDRFVAFSYLNPMGMSRASYLLNLFTADDSQIKETLDIIVYHMLIEKHIHKIELIIEYDDHITEQAATELGFVQISVMADEIPLSDGSFKDAGMFSLVLPDYKGYNVGFLAFQRGITAVYGTNDHIDKLKVFHYGDEPKDYLTKTVAQAVGILDAEQRFLPRNSEEYFDLDNSFLPSEVEKAVDQLSEYFIKKRDTFDIKVEFNDCTPFQKEVWNALCSIPYGKTVSYEDVAEMIDKQKARKLTRAVGAACGDNPVPIIVPCHRVIGKDGKLVGYSLGVDIKDFLLQHESGFMTII